MGALIALHAVATCSSQKQPPCDALILSSPIARIHDDFPQWKRTALRWGARLFPRWKISLETLSGENEVHVIRDVIHQEQVQANPYHVSAFTMRLLSTLGTMIETSTEQATRIELPVLLLHGGHDIFSRPDDVKTFAGRFPPAARVKRHFYPESYHLLFYDHQKERVLADITRWLRSLNRS
jgi:alpha-beta hydrolase superfamily lysophospholipase